MMGPTILLVDDEPNVRRALMRVFAEEGYRIFTASNSDQALAVLREHAIDVIISDERMPGTTGVQLLKIAREVSPATVRIMLTGYIDMDAAITAINEGEIFRFLLKPWNDEELRAAVRLGIERHRGLKSPPDQAADRRHLMEGLKRQYPGIDAVQRGPDGSILL